jgi:5-methyltetrahydropteroyltriglutamate--homocysteine methyltransferase
LPMLFPTTLVGSYPQPNWLIDRDKLAGRFPPRVRAKELWRIPEPYLSEAQEDATMLAIAAQEAAGLDIVTDGEIRRESYSNRFATALEGIDIDKPGSALDRSGHPNPVPRIVGKIRRRHPVEVEDLKFLRRHTKKPVKITVPGPFTMAQQAQNDFYASEEEAAMDYAEAVNAEMRDLFAAGADIVQIDEPYMQARPEKARAYGLKPNPGTNQCLPGLSDRFCGTKRLLGNFRNCRCQKPFARSTASIIARDTAMTAGVLIRRRTSVKCRSRCFTVQKPGLRQAFR